MTGLTEAVEVGRIEEQRLISLMGFPMVNNAGSGDPSECVAQLAQRLCL